MISDEIRKSLSKRMETDDEWAYGVYKGIRVDVICTNGKIATIFPNFDQSSLMKRRKRK